MANVDSKELLVLNEEDGTTVSLNNKHQLMAQYICDGSSNSKARILAGFQDYALGKEGEEAKAGRQLNAQYAYKLIQNQPDILVYANYLRQAKRKELSLTVDDLLKTSAAILSFDPASLFDTDGNPIENIHEIDPTARAAIKEFKFIEKADGTRSVEYKFYDKLNAVGMLTKLQDLAGDKVKARMSDKKVTLKTFD